MRDFHILKTKINEKLKEMEKKYSTLFVANVDNDKIWNLYLDSFPKEENQIFRERRHYDCNCCKHFFKNIGNVVALNNNLEYESIWDIETGDEVFDQVVSELAKEVRKYPIARIFKSEIEKFGAEDNFDNYLTDVKWSHFMYQVAPKYMVAKGEKTSFIGETSIKRRMVLEMLETISLSSLESVNDLIKDKILYKGNEYSHIVEKTIELKKQFDKIEAEKRINFIWSILETLPTEVAKVKNTSIGTLIFDINEGTDLETAVKKYEAVVAPENYKRSKPVYTKKMLEEAKKTILDLGYLNSLNRKYADIDDISINEVLFVNRNILKKSDDIFSQLEENVIENPKKFSKAEKISVDKFKNEILPNAKDIKVLVERKHTKNFMSLTTSKEKDAKSMFKWDNNFAWNYIGGVADSKMKEEVVKKGGNVIGDLRFSIMWNDEKKNLSDLDAHCIEKIGNRKNEIYFGNKKSDFTNGELDVDIIDPRYTTDQRGIAVENIIYPSKKGMKNGEYDFFVDYYTRREGYMNGFKAEIEIEGEVYSYEFSGMPFKNDQVKIAKVFLTDKGFEIKHMLDNETSINSQKIWGVNTNQFVEVKAITTSPNYWGENATGNEHLFFFLNGCVSAEKPNGIFNEFLKEELYRNHRKVFEALGQMANVEETENQLSGIGFSLTKKNNLIVKVDNKLYNIEF